MTKSDKTAILLILDRSGSMDDIKTDAEGGIKTFIDDQRKVPGECTLRVVDFDTEYRVVYPSTDIHKAAYPTIQPRGMTALCDAWGYGVTEFGEELAALPEDERPGTVIVVVVTDGLENASQEWTRKRIFDLTKRQSEQYGWTFLFLAAGQDAIAEGATYGVAHANSSSFRKTAKGTEGTYAAASASVTRTRSGGSSGFTEAERATANS